MSNDDTGLGDPENVLDEGPQRNDGAGLESDGTVIRSAASDTVRITRSGRTVTVDCSGLCAADGQIRPERQQEIVQTIAAFDCSRIVIDLTGISAVPGGLLELLLAINNGEREIEILNPSPEVQEALRVAQLDSVLLLRGGT